MASYEKITKGEKHKFFVYIDHRKIDILFKECHRKLKHGATFHHTHIEKQGLIDKAMQLLTCEHLAKENASLTNQEKELNTSSKKSNK